MPLQRDPEGTEPRTLHEFADFNGTRVLEIGCGDGRLTWKYARSARQVMAIDLEAEDLRVARIERPNDLDEHVHFVRCDSITLPFQKESFDIALLSWSL